MRLLPEVTEKKEEILLDHRQSLLLALDDYQKTPVDMALVRSSLFG